MSKVLRTMTINSTLVIHKCVNCGRIIPYGRKMKIAVMATKEKLHNDYWCIECAEANKHVFEEVQSGLTEDICVH